MEKIEELYSKFKELGRDIKQECAKHEWCSGCPFLYKDLKDEGQCKILDIVDGVDFPLDWHIPEDD